MAKVTVESLPTPPPPKQFTLVLDEKEMAVLYALVGGVNADRTDAAGAVAALYDAMYGALNSGDPYGPYRLASGVPGDDAWTTGTAKLVPTEAFLRKLNS